MGWFSIGHVFVSLINNIWFWKIFSLVYNCS